MKTIRVTFRASFRQPIGVLNPSGFRLSAVCPVEVFGGDHGRWYARELASPRRTLYDKLGHFATAESGQAIVRQAFEDQVQPWQIWGVPPDSMPPLERLLTPDEICDLGDGKWGWYGPEDRTHIIHAPNIPPGAKIPPAACGAKVDAKHFISTKANLEPTCPRCAEIYRKEYAK